MVDVRSDASDHFRRPHGFADGAALLRESIRERLFHRFRHRGEIGNFVVSQHLHRLVQLGAMLTGFFVEPDDAVVGLGDFRFGELGSLA